jgi:hypothetical protein
MAAWKGNYGGTFLSDLVTRPEFLAYTQEDIYNQCKWIQSGAVVRNSALDCRDGGVRVQVPFFKPIDPTETIIESNNTWGGDGTTTGYLNPQKITAGDQIMTILHRGFSYAADDLSKMGSGADPMAAIRGYLTKAINKLRTRVLISQLEGLFDTALATQVYDNSSSTTAGLSDANFLTAASVIGGRNKLGERGDELTIIAMHSAVYNYLLQVGALTFSTSALSTGGAVTWGGGGVGLTSVDVAYFMGLRVVVDDMLAPDTSGEEDVYPCYLMTNGAVAEGVQQELRLAADRNILSLQDVLAVDYHYGFHVNGTKWAAAGDNPDNTALETGSNWELAFTEVKMTDVVKILVNTPF